MRSNQGKWTELRGPSQSNRVLDRLQGGSSRKFSNNRNSQPGREGSIKIWNMSYSFTAFHSKEETVAAQSIFLLIPALADFLKLLKDISMGNYLHVFPVLV